MDVKQYILKELKWLKQSVLYLLSKTFPAFDSSNDGQVLTVNDGELEWMPPAGGDVTEPDGQVVFGTGTGIDSSSNLTYNTSTNTLFTPTLAGSTVSTGTLTLSSTSNATKGNIIFGSSVYDEVNNRLGIGVSSPLSQIHLGYISNSGINFDDVGGGQFYIRATSGSNLMIGSTISGHHIQVSRINVTILGQSQVYHSNLTALGRSTTSPTAFCDLTGATTSFASLRIRNGVAPTSPNNGDVWYDGTDLFMRMGGLTRKFVME